MSAAYAWSDTMTVMQALGGKRMAKTILQDGTVHNYDDAYLYDATTLHLSGLEDLRHALERLLRLPYSCVVRGALVAGETATRIRRLLHPDTKNGCNPTVLDVPRRWLALDADGLDLPAGVSPADLLSCAEVVLDRLPSAFASAAAIVQASAGHGIKPGIRLRLWFWCDRPLSGDELKRWLRDAPLDPSVYRPAQPIYSAAPIFEGDRVDHILHRLADWPGYGWLATPSAEELAPPPRPAPTTVQPACVSGSARARLYVEAARSKAHTRITSAELRHPAILSEACGLARFVKQGLITEADLHDTLWAAAQQAGKADETEIARMVSFGLANPSTTPLPIEA